MVTYVKCKKQSSYILILYHNTDEKESKELVTVYYCSSLCQAALWLNRTITKIGLQIIERSPIIKNVLHEKNKKWDNYSEQDEAFTAESVRI